MNVFDFDGTIYDGDSTADFYLFLLRRHPGLPRDVPALGVAAVKRKLGKMTLTEMKNQLYTFIPKIPNMNAELELFWKTHMCNIMSWYLLQRESTDVVISASPEFLLQIPCKTLGWECLIASDVDIRTGKYHGLNCKGEEKVKRFRKLYPNAHIDAFYSDSWSDLPLAKLADRAYLVKHRMLQPWNTKKAHK